MEERGNEAVIRPRDSRRTSPAAEQRGVDGRPLLVLAALDADRGVQVAEEKVRGT